MKKENNIPISDFLARYKKRSQENPRSDAGGTEIGISEDNIFSILNVEDKEVFHCRFLKYLIGSRWESFVGNVLAKKCDTAKIGALRYARCEYPCEAIENCPLGKEGRLDLYFETAECVVAFEVKWYAGEQPVQLLRYFHALKKQNGREVKLFFLTPDGRAPSTAECREQCGVACRRSLREGEYFTLSFREISEWIAALQAAETSRNGYLLEQYREVLCEEERKMAAMEKLSEVLKDPDDFQTAKQIADSFKSLCEQIRTAFFGALKAELERQMENVDGKCGKFVGVRGGKEKEQTIELVFRDEASSDGKDENVFCCGYDTNLYCHDSGGWWYITPEWFQVVSGEVKKNYDENKKNNKNKIDVKDFEIHDCAVGNPVVNWYYGGRDEETIEKVVKNMLRYFEILS